MDHFKKYLSTTKLDVKMEYLADQQLLAIQGKGAAAVVARLTPNIDFKKMPFMNGAVATVAGQFRSLLFLEITYSYSELVEH
jgi:glycine cleavage system aminomethyltransferase T